MDEIIYPILKLTNPRIRYVISSLISSNIMYIKSTKYCLTLVSNTIEMQGDVDYYYFKKKYRSDINY